MRHLGYLRAKNQRNTMKFKDIRQEKGTKTTPGTVAQMALDAIEDGLTFAELLQKFDYDSIDEPREALTEVIRAGATDPAVCEFAKSKEGKPAVSTAVTLNRRAKSIWDSDSSLREGKVYHR